MITSVALLLVSAVVIYLSCEFFVNGVEWVGRKTGVAETAVGTILAAFGTALPESVVTFSAVAFGHDDAAKQVGVGAALGGPLVLSTIAYAVVGAVLWATRPKGAWHIQPEESKRLSRDQTWFLMIFVCKVGLGLVAFTGKPLLAFAFLAAYGAYVWTEMRGGGEVGTSEMEPLKLRPSLADPGLGWALLQTALALAVIFGASQLFVHQLESLAPHLGLPPSLVALLLSPVATELPETMNALIWVREGKERLALANISGAMMIQATIPSALGIYFTEWRLGGPLLWAAVVTTAAVAGLMIVLKRHALTPPRLAAFALGYVVFAVGVVWGRMG